MNCSLPSTLAFLGGMIPLIISGTLKEHIVILFGANIVFFAKYAGVDETSALGTAGRPRAVKRGTSCPLIRIESLEWMWSILFCLRKGLERFRS
jgi:hypothetical protein